MKKVLYLICLFLLTNYFSTSAQSIDQLYHWEDPTLVGSNAYDNTYNEIWGLVRNDKEFAVIGSTYGTHIFDVTDTDNVVEVAKIPGAFQGGGVIHRDFHDYKDHLYIVCDEGTGTSTLQIVDISDLPNSFEVVTDSKQALSTSHNIFIDTTHAKLYACGGATSDGLGGNKSFRLKVFDLADDPTKPVELFTTKDEFGYIHDIYVKDNIAYLNAGSGSGLIVVDFTDTSAPITLGKMDEYSAYGQGYNHSGWLSEDGSIYAFADETHGIPIKICDASDPTDLVVLSTVRADNLPDQEIPHNLMIRGNYLFVSYYYDGLVIFDISDPEEPKKVAEYDTYAGEHRRSYEGAWGIYAFLPSGKLLVSDMQTGLYVLDFDLLTNEINNATSNQDLTATTENIQITAFESTLQIQVQLKQAQRVQIELFDLTGRLIQSYQSQQGIGQQQIQLDLPETISGTYFIAKVKTKGAYYTQKIYSH